MIVFLRSVFGRSSVCNSGKLLQQVTILLPFDNDGAMSSGKFIFWSAVSSLPHSK